MGISRYREAKAVFLVWLCFMARGIFYAAMLPVWEGFDEHVHFAYIQHVVHRGALPEHGALVSREVEESLKLLPLPWMLRDWDPSYTTHDEYWNLPMEERKRRETTLRALPREWAGRPAEGHLPIYEAQQPPLYYWLMSVLLRAASGLSLPGRVFYLRLLSLLLASLSIPAGYLLAKHVLRSHAAATGIAALVAVMPGLMIDVVRIGNDSFALPLYTMLVYAALVLVEQPHRRKAAFLVAAGLGLGLLTKAYFLTALPALAVILLLHSRGPNAGRLAFRGTVAIVIALGFSAWWYWRSRVLTGSWSGLMQDVALRHSTIRDLLKKAPEVDWLNALDSTLLSHIWFGAWSFLQVRAWMYHVYYFAGFLALLGLLAYAARSLFSLRPGAPMHQSRMGILSLFYVSFWLGIGYHVLLTYTAMGQSSSAGWYLYCAIFAQTLLILAGLAFLCPAAFRPWLAPSATMSFALLDLYGVHFLLMPYYVGLIRHKADGALATFHIGRIQEAGIGDIFARVAACKPYLSAPGAMALWLCYLAATGMLAVFSVRFGRQAWKEWKRLSKKPPGRALP
jgi:4-amino-4-deoxy-L-arabinose transferase-like glycosyltransferase